MGKVLGTRTADSFAAVFDPDIAPKRAKCVITWLDSPADMFQLAFIHLGLDAHTERPEDRAVADALLTHVRPYARYFNSSQYLNDLASGEVCVSVGWSGAIEQARARGSEAAQPVEVVYVIPKESAPLWSDLVLIPVDAPHPEYAFAFIDYLMEPRVMAAITNTVGQAIGNDPMIYPDDETCRRLTIVSRVNHPDTARQDHRRRTPVSDPRSADR